MTETADTRTIRSIVEVLGRHALVRGDAVAVEGARDKLTYRQLDESSTAIARAVRDSVDGRHKAVALLIDHGVQQHEAVMGVLKSGHICLPLEPTQPERRLAQIVGHARPAAILADVANHPVAERLAGDNLPILTLSDVSTHDGSSIDIDINPGDPALILYTSGSTGRPKGVLHTHENIVDSAVMHVDSVAMCKEDRVSMMYSYTSSAGLKVDVVSALAAGARVCLYDLRAGGMSGVAAWLREKKITVYHSVPEVFRESCTLLDDGELFARVRWVQLGGAQVRWSDYDLFRKHFSLECRFANGLGATETGRVSLHVITGGSVRYSENIPVGHPVERVHVRLIDEEGADVVASAPGQIIVSSPSLASGYWRDPELTASAFRQGEDGRRWYYTGDLATRTPDGMLEIVGRTDFVVNVNGNRVDVAEVELALKSLDGIKDAAVVAQQASGNVDLTAYLVSDSGNSDFRGLRQILGTMLPSYMIPTTLVGVDALPTTPSGKLNRSALPRSTQGVASVLPAERTPKSELASTIAAVWCEILGVDEVREDDDFLDLGGSSMRGMRMLTEIEKRLGLTIPVKLLFEAENFGAFVRVVREVQTSSV